MSRHTTITAFCAIVLAVLFLGWQQFGQEIQAVRDRGEIPVFEGEPFFPDADPRAEAVVAATRYSLLRWAARDAADAEAEVPAEDEAGVPDDAEPAVEPVEEPPLTTALLHERFPALEGMGADERWIVTLYLREPGRKRIRPRVVTLDAGLLDAAALLYDAIPSRLRDAEGIGASTFKIDLVLGEDREIPEGGGLRGVTIDEGLDGIVLRHPKEDDFYFLPSMAIERKVGRHKIHGRARLYAREIGGWSRKHTKDEDVTWAAFRTRGWAEATPGGPTLVAITRGNADVPEISPEVLRERIGMAGAHLTRETNSDGMITYEYQAAEDELGGRDYNILRHAGTTYSMMQAYRVTGDRATYEASVRAMEFYKRAMKEDDKHPGEWFVRSVSKLNPDGSPRVGRRAKLGGIGLGLCMMVELEKAEPGTVDMELVRGMAMHVERMQNPDGSFDSFYNWNGREKSIRKSIYYSGEAILGLLRYHQLTGDEHFLDVAVDGADYLTHDRWKSLGVRIYTPPDAWLIQALEEMDRVRPDEARERYAFEIGEMIARHKLMDPERAPPDLLGADLSGVKSMPNAATAGSFGEALSAAARLEARRRPGETRFLTFAMNNAGFQLRNQFWGPNEYFLPNPARAHGGFRVKPDDAEIRNDYTQHNLSGLFGLLDLLDETAPDIAWIVPEERRPTAGEGGTP
jgi:hypothetical protein